MKTLIAWIIAGAIVFFHGAAVVSWASARDFRDWNFYAHATWQEGIYYHTMYLPAVAPGLIVGALCVGVGYLAVRR